MVFMLLFPPFEPPPKKYLYRLFSFNNFKNSLYESPASFIASFIASLKSEISSFLLDIPAFLKDLLNLLYASLYPTGLSNNDEIWDFMLIQLLCQNPTNFLPSLF